MTESIKTVPQWSSEVTVIKLPSREFHEQFNDCVGYEVLIAVIMKSYIFSDITSCSFLKVNRRVGGTFRLHLQNCLLLDS
jgi:hypothetical protein